MKFQGWIVMYKLAYFQMFFTLPQNQNTHVSLAEIFENSSPCLIINPSEAKNFHDYTRMCQWPDVPKRKP